MRILNIKSGLHKEEDCYFIIQVKTEYETEVDIVFAVRLLN